MLDLAYPSLTQIGDTYEVGPVSDKVSEGYLWHYWIPTLALLDREHLRLRKLDQVLMEGGPFVFPLEFRWELIDCLARGLAAEFLTPHIPPAVLTSARAGTAIILLSFGHEARPLSFAYIPDKKTLTRRIRQATNRVVRAGKQVIGQAAATLESVGSAETEIQSLYDLIYGFVCRHDLPSSAVWFINGNLRGQSEYRSWKRRRFGDEDAPEPFETRFIEPFSYMAQLTRRERERGFDLAVNWQATRNGNGLLFHQMTRLTLGRLSPGSNSVAATLKRPRGADALPPKLFLCMNRFTRQHRRSIVCHLLRRGFLERSLVSFRDDYPERTSFDDPEMQTAWQELRKRQPLTIDRDLPLDSEAYFQSNFAAVQDGEFWPYRDTCFSIVTETHFNNDTLFVSEKLWKPIFNYHPFIVVGTPGTLAYLRGLGFQTFTPLIDESYDSLVDDEQRMQALFATIDALGALDDSQRAAKLAQMQPMLAHNAQHMRQLRSTMARVFANIDAKLTATG